MDRTELLIERIHDSDVKVADLATKLGMDRSTFYRKIKAPNGQFTVEDAVKIQQALQLSKDDFDAIFF